MATKRKKTAAQTAAQLARAAAAVPVRQQIEDKVIAKTGGEYGPPEPPRLTWIPRFSIHGLAIIILFGLTVWLAPEAGATSPQINIIQSLAFALSRLSLGGMIGFMIWRAGFKNIRIDMTSPRDPVTAKLIESRGLCIAAGMIALSLGG